MVECISHVRVSKCFALKANNFFHFFTTFNTRSLEKLLHIKLVHHDDGLFTRLQRHLCGSSYIMQSCPGLVFLGRSCVLPSLLVVGVFAGHPDFPARPCSSCDSPPPKGGVADGLFDGKFPRPLPIGLVGQLMRTLQFVLLSISCCEARSKAIIGMNRRMIRGTVFGTL